LAAGALASAGMLAAVSMPLSAVPFEFGVPVALASLVWGCALARSHLALVPCRLEWKGDRLRVTGLRANDQADDYSAPRAEVRTGIAVLRAADAQGRVRCWVWWPDTLDGALRRDLRLRSGAVGRA
jgi:hypothetical protein